MIQIEEKEIVKGIDEAYKKAGSNAYFGNGFQAGVDFALKRVKNLTIPSVSKRYQVTDIQLSDWESVAIGDTETNKVVCHFLTENGFDEAVETAKKITKFLNGC